MVCGELFLNGPTDLEVTEKYRYTAIVEYHMRHPTAYGYRDVILHLPFAYAIGPESVLMDDNVRPQRTRIVRDYLEEETAERMDWQAVSPDLHLIEHIRDQLHTCISRPDKPPRTGDDLANAEMKERQNIPMQNSRHLIQSRQRHWRTAINDRGSK